MPSVANFEAHPKDAPRQSLKYTIIAVAINRMRFTFDPAKNDKKIAQRSLSFTLAAELDWEAAFIVEDTRRDYGEMRLRVLALLHGRLHAIVVTPRKDELRIISSRKANRKEEKIYEQHPKT